MEVLATMRPNKLKKLMLLALSSGALLLAGCDQVEAPYPNDDPIVNIDGYNGTIYNNTLKQIYETLVTSGDTNSEKILNNILYIYSQSVFGPFFGADGLRAVATSGDNAKIDAYGAKYVALQVKNADGSINVEATRTRVISFYNEVLYRINDVFFGYVKDSSYQDRSKFVEEKFYKAQIKNYYDLPTELNGEDPYITEHQLVLGEDRLSEDPTEGSALINKYFKDVFAVYENYIEINVLPDIYRRELTAQYLIDENFDSTLRNIASRKVDYITLAADTNNKVSALLNAYDAKVIKDATKSNYDLTFLDRLYKGVDQALYDASTDEGKLAAEIYKDANWTLKTIDLDGNATPEYSYYEESQFGAICEKYKILLSADNRYDANFETQWNNFTSNGSYSKETGFEIQRRELVSKNNTTAGWYTPGGLSSLPDSLKNRIFKTQVANEMMTLENNGDAGDYLEQEGGKTYLLPLNPLSSDTHKYIVKDGSNYTIVQVDEAVKSSRLNASDTNSYYGQEKADAVSRKVAYSLASSDTWAKAAKSYYVEKMSIIYHDEYVLNYFKTTFPELFD